MSAARPVLLPEEGPYFRPIKRPKVKPKAASKPFIVPSGTETPRACGDFFCSAEWHLARQSKAAIFIYHWALRISKKSGRFRVSPRKAAEHFGFKYRTVVRAYSDLKKLGFFALLESGKSNFEASVFQVFTHSSWQKRKDDQGKINVDKCIEKLEFPWSGERDELREELSIAADGKIPFKPFQIDWYRTSGFSDAEIANKFREWLPRFRAGKSGKSWRKGAAYWFGKTLECEGKTKSSSSRLHGSHLSR